MKQHLMNVLSGNSAVDETAWIKAYMDLAGVTESQARNVFMYVGCRDFVSAENDCAIEQTPTNRSKAPVTKI